MEASQSDPQDATPTQDQGSATTSGYPTAAEQQAAHEQREIEQDQARAEHNARTGGGETQEGARQTLRDEHLERTTGTAESSPEPSEPAQADGDNGSQDAG